MKFETRAIHAGQEPDPLTGAVNVPIYQTSTYVQDGVGQMRAGYDYARTSTRRARRCRSASRRWRAARHGVAFASGMAAIQARARRPFEPGTRVAGDERRLRRHLPPVREGAARAGLPLRLRRPLRPGRRSSATLAAGVDLVWVETPTNPLLKIVDIAAVAERAHAAGALLAVDNTFASPYLQQPLALGADIVVHSTTKYIGGHSDVVGGVAILDDDARAEHLAFLQNAIGAVPGAVRLLPGPARRQDARGADARALRERPPGRGVALPSAPGVGAVLYPGLPTHPGHEVAARQMRDFGGMVSFRLLRRPRSRRRAVHRRRHRRLVARREPRRRREPDRASRRR